MIPSADPPLSRREALSLERRQAVRRGSREGRRRSGRVAAGAPAAPSRRTAVEVSSVGSRLILPPSPSAVRQGTRIGLLAAMVFVGSTVVATSVPANAYFVDTPDVAAAKFAAAESSVGGSVGVGVGAGAGAGAVADAARDAAVASGQSYTAAAGAEAQPVGRDGYRVTSPEVAAASSGPAIAWPFPSGAATPISSGFGSRQVADCSFCSTNHQGLDFTPGRGTPIHVVASGVVSRVDQGSGALGYNVWVDHVIDGRPVTTVYAHMSAGSIAVAMGQRVTVSEVLGAVGSTGNSTGAHLHFEVHLAGTPVDPMPWLRAHAR